MNISQNLKCLLDERNLTQKALSQYLGIATSTINNWIKLNRSIPSEYIIPICEFFDISPYKLLAGEEKSPSTVELTAEERELLDVYNSLSPMSRGQLKERAIVLSELEVRVEPESEEPETRFIEYSTLKVSAGTGQYLDTGLMEQMKIIKNELTTDASFAVKITGDSMEPLYENGEIVLVKSQPTVELGEVGIFIVGGLGYIKKLGEDRLISVNPYYNDILFHEEDEIYCKGLVIGVLEDGDIVD